MVGMAREKVPWDEALAVTEKQSNSKADAYNMIIQQLRSRKDIPSCQSQVESHRSMKSAV